MTRLKLHNTKNRYLKITQSIKLVSLIFLIATNNISNSCMMKLETELTAIHNNGNNSNKMSTEDYRFSKILQNFAKIIIL